MSIKASLTCINANIQQNKWLNCLSKVDKDIHEIQNKINQSTELIVISLPYSLNYIKKSIEEAISIEFARDCFDIIVDFMIPNKKHIQQNITSNNSSDANEHKIDINNQWTPNKHDQLIQTESIIIINRKTAEFQSIPRNVIALIPDYNNNNNMPQKWQITWNRTIKNYEWMQIYSIIGNNIANIYLSNHFELNGDWSQKTDFSDTLSVGYLCDSGEIANGSVVKQNSYKCQIFVHFETDSSIFGEKFKWIQIPHSRLCAPKHTKHTKHKETKKIRDLSTFYCNPPGQKRRESDLERAIAISLEQQYIKNNDNNYNTSYKQNDDEDINRAIAASLGQQYTPKVENTVLAERGNDANSTNKTDDDLEQQSVSNGNNDNNGNYINFEDEDDLLQRAIAESLQLQQ